MQILGKIHNGFTVVTPTAGVIF